MEVGLRKVSLEMAVKPKENVRVKGGDPRHLIGRQT